MVRWSSAISESVPPSPRLSSAEQQDVFQRDDDDQRPQHQRDDAEHIVALQDAFALRVDVVDAFLESVERAGADVAEHDADRCQGKRPEPVDRRVRSSAAG
jgi:hypothetical protein